MSGDLLAAGVLFAATGLALSSATSLRALFAGLAVLLVSAGATATVPLDIPSSVGSMACWAGVLGAYAWVLLVRALGWRSAVLLGLAGGVCGGLLIGAVAHGPVLEPIFGPALAPALAPALGATLPVALLAFPARWLTAQGHAVVVKVVATWLAATALLSLGLLLTSAGVASGDHLQ